MWQFQTTSQQKCSILRPLLSSTFPQGFRISLDIRLREVGEKYASKYTCKKGTNRQTDKHTHRQTIPLLDRIGPVGRFDENTLYFCCQGNPRHLKCPYFRQHQQPKNKISMNNLQLKTCLKVWSHLTAMFCNPTPQRHWKGLKQSFL